MGGWGLWWGWGLGAVFHQVRCECVSPAVHAREQQFFISAEELVLKH